MKFLSMYMWMDHQAKQENNRILHKLNNGEEIRIGPYLVDGYCPETNTVYEFLGDFFHGHDCLLTKKIRNRKWRKNNQNYYKELRKD